MVAADDPHRAVFAQHAPRLGQPLACKTVIFGEIGELVPVVIDAIDQAVIRAPQLAPQLQVIGRVSEDAVDRSRREHAHHLHTVAAKDLIQGQVGGDVQNFPAGWLRCRRVETRQKPRQSLGMRIVYAAAGSCRDALPERRGAAMLPAAAPYTCP